MRDEPPILWTCEACGEVRPDEMIGLLKKEYRVDGFVMAKEDFRYCKDKPACERQARDFTRLKEIAMSPRSDLDPLDDLRQTESAAKAAQDQKGSEGKAKLNSPFRRRGQVVILIVALVILAIVGVVFFQLLGRLPW